MRVTFWLITLTTINIFPWFSLEVTEGNSADTKRAGFLSESSKKFLPYFRQIFAKIHNRILTLSYQFCNTPILLMNHNISYDTLMWPYYMGYLSNEITNLNTCVNTIQVQFICHIIYGNVSGGIPDSLFHLIIINFLFYKW